MRPSDCRPALRELASNVADQREHGTTGEVPIERFRRAEARALRPIAGAPPFAMAFELVRKVQPDCVIGVDGNAYSVRWRLIGESVRVVIAGDQLRISHVGREVAVHRRRTGRFQYCRPAPLRRRRRLRPAGACPDCACFGHCLPTSAAAPAARI